MVKKSLDEYLNSLKVFRIKKIVGRSFSSNFFRNFREQLIRIETCIILVQVFRKIPTRRPGITPYFFPAVPAEAHRIIIREYAETDSKNPAVIFPNTWKKSPSIPSKVSAGIPVKIYLKVTTIIAPEIAASDPPGIFAEIFQGIVQVFIQ